MNVFEYKKELEDINNNLVDLLQTLTREQQDKVLFEILKNKSIISRLNKVSVSEAEKEIDFSFVVIESKL